MAGDTDIFERRNPITQGVIGRQLLIFFFPILLGNFFQQFYTVADALIVGRFVGKDAFAAIDSTVVLFRLPISFFIGTSSGATILVSQAYGARDYERVSGLVHTAIAGALLFGAALSAAGFLAAPGLLRWMAVPGDIYRTALIYDEILFAGMFLPLMFNIGCGILRAVGDSRRPFYYLGFCSVANVVLDLLFIAVLGWGTVGAAAATVIAQALSVLLIFTSLCRADGAHRLSLSKVRLSMKRLRDILKTGLPIGLQSSTYPLANVLIQARINSFGTNVIAAWAACGKLDFIVWLILEALCLSVSTFAAQNYGARQPDRVRRSVTLCVNSGLLAVAGMTVFLFAFFPSLVRIFIADEEVVRMSTDMMRFISPFYFFAVWAEVYPSAIRATGETIRPMILTMLSPCLLRIVWIFCVSPFFESLYMVIVVFPLSWVATAAMFAVYYRRYSRNRLFISLDA